MPCRCSVSTMLPELRANAAVIAALPLCGGRRVARIGHKKGQGVVTPVVGHAAFDQVVLVHVQLHRQQAQRGQPKALVVRQHGRAGQSRVGAALRGRHAGVQGASGP